MYETLLGSTATWQDAINNNFINQFQSRVTDSHPIISANRQTYSMAGLSRMLNSRNSHYQSRLNFFLPFPLESRHNIAYKQTTNESHQQCEPKLLKYDFKNADTLLDELQQDFCQFGMHSEVDIQENLPKQRVSQFINALAQTLRKMNQQTIAKIDTNGELPATGRALAFISMLGVVDSYILQLKRHLQIVDQTKKNSQILSKILSQANSNPLLFYQTLELGLTLPISQIRSVTQKHKTIYILFLTETPRLRPKLDRFLYETRQQNLFELINYYDKIMSDSSSHSWVELEDYHRRLNLWGNSQEPTQPLKCLLSIMSLHENLTIDFECQAIFDEQSWYDFRMWLLGLKVGRWSMVKMQNEVEELNLHKVVLGTLRKARSLFSISTPLHQLRLICYNMSLNCLPQDHKILVLLLICIEPQIFKRLVSLDQEEFKFHQYQKQFTQFLMQISENRELSGLIIDCMGITRREARAPILLSNKSLVQAIDWQYMMQLISERQQKEQLMKVVILRSIKMYKNTSSFLNTEIPIETLLPYFEIEILIQGFIQILIENVQLSEKNRMKFFGMMSIYRGQNLPGKFQFTMIILEMLFEWYILKQSVLGEDYKSIGKSLKSNLEQVNEEEQVSNFSVRMTESSRAQSMVKIHNHELLVQIGSPQFIAHLNQKSEYHELYIGYMQVIGSALCKISNSKQKIIRKSKLEIWVEAYLRKLTSSLKQARNQLGKKLSRLRQTNLKLFARQSF